MTWRPSFRDRRPARGAMLAVLIGLIIHAGPAGARSTEGSTPAAPRLVLFVVLDQVSFDTLERFEPALSGGLARLLDEGVVFTNAFHRHAVPTTAPGHATLATGRHPRHHGIVGNWWWDRHRGEEVYCVEDAEERTGPYHLLAPTLGDWLRDRDPEARVFAASPKDRGAVLLAGLEPDGAFWYDDDSGTFVTGEYYGEEEPAWLTGLAGERWVDRFFGRPWEPLPVPDGLRERLEAIDLDSGVFDRTFPHALGRSTTAPSESFYGAIYDSPFVDELLVEVVRRLVEAEDLGTDDHTDLLGVSFSSMDTVGHEYGPHSPEALDTLLRIDRALGRLLDLLEERVGRNRLVVSLAADHGVMPLPEYERLRGRDARREGADEVACIQGVHAGLRQELGEQPWLEAPGYLDAEAVFRSGLPRREVEQAARKLLEDCPSVERIWTRSELEGADSGPSREPDPEEADAMAVLYRNAFHPDRSPDLMIQRKPYHLTRAVPGTTHTSPYPYDTHVPMIVRAPGLEPARVERPVATVDLAPTVAALAGIPVPEDLDGEALLPAADPAVRPRPVP